MTLFKQYISAFVKTGLVTFVGVALAFWGILALGTPSMAADSAANNEDIYQGLVEYLIKNPRQTQRVMEALRANQARQKDLKMQQALRANKEDIYNSADDFVVGNPKADVTIVEFFDYRCSYCQKTFPELMKLVQADSGVKVIFKEFPVLGEASYRATQAAMAARRQGKYFELHKRLMGQKQPLNEARLFMLADLLKIDKDTLMEDMKNPDIRTAVNKTYALAEKLGIRGTPTMIINDKVIYGFHSLAELRALVAKARGEKPAG